MPKIKDLSKDELLGLIYNHLPNTLIGRHPCCCVVCAKDYDVDIGKKAYSYICDGCEGGALKNEP
jgi:hypothetical protein